MNSQDTLAGAARHGVVPVIAIESEECALPLADALIAGGLPVIEITFRTAAAARVIALLRRERPGLLVGAGTVLTRENVDAAVDAGARFAVAPGFNPDTVRHARGKGLPFIPGVATPSDVEAALTAGCNLLKLFPAGVLGGVAMLKALSGPYQHTGVRFMPTGGVNLENLRAYLAMPVTAAVGGTWLAPKEDIAAGNWEGIRARCAEAVGVVRSLRG
jgi:2-dehydro-3-deoxyphosphogluconate aldolase/(4S)-4-hydroxy-2-oxoglutarate aldolase